MASSDNVTDDRTIPMFPDDCEQGTTDAKAHVYDESIAIEQELISAEHVIESSIRRSFYNVGLTLKNIRDRRLYRTSYSSFQVYCRKRWSWSEAHVTRLVQAAEVCDTLPKGKGCVLPYNERQIRPMLLLDEPEHRLEVWERVLKRTKSEGAPLSSGLVSKEVRRKLKEIGVRDTNAMSSSKQRKRSAKKTSAHIAVAYVEMPDSGANIPPFDIDNIAVDLLYISTPSRWIGRGGLHDPVRLGRGM